MKAIEEAYNQTFNWTTDMLSIGLLANQASVTADLVHAAEVLLRLARCRLVMIFGPEHGLRGAEQDMVPVADEGGHFLCVPVHTKDAH